MDHNSASRPHAYYSDMNLNSMLNGSDSVAVKKRKNSAHIHNMLNSTSPSRKTSISRKPKKYSEPPIWARSWKTSKGIKQAPKPLADPKSVEGQGPGGIASLIGLPPSISGFVPADDLNRRITEWIYGNLHTLGDKRKYIELEFKLGIACSKTNNKRVLLPVLSEALLEANFVKEQVYFEPGIPHNLFGRLETMMDQYSAAHTLESDGEMRTRDQFHPVDGGNVVRVSLDERDQLVEKIIKQRVGDLIVYLPHEDIDIRVSLSLEIPFEGSAQDVKAPNLVRNKNRTSWKTQGMRVDLTNVITEGKGSTKEVELELDSSMLLQYFTDFDRKSDPQAMEKFEELIRFGLDNCRVLTRGLKSAQS